jgi:hypothetical protein
MRRAGDRGPVSDVDIGEQQGLAVLLLVGNPGAMSPRCQVLPVQIA